MKICYRFLFLCRATVLFYEARSEGCDSEDAASVMVGLIGIIYGIIRLFMSSSIELSSLGAHGIVSLLQKSIYEIAYVKTYCRHGWCRVFRLAFM